MSRIRPACVRVLARQLAWRRCVRGDVDRLHLDAGLRRRGGRSRPRRKYARGVRMTAIALVVLALTGSATGAGAASADRIRPRRQARRREPRNRRAAGRAGSRGTRPSRMERRREARLRRRDDRGWTETADGVAQLVADRRDGGVHRDGRLRAFVDGRSRRADNPAAFVGRALGGVRGRRPHRARTKGVRTTPGARARRGVGLAERQRPPHRGAAPDRHDADRRGIRSGRKRPLVERPLRLVIGRRRRSSALREPDPARADPCLSRLRHCLRLAPRLRTQATTATRRTASRSSRTATTSRTTRSSRGSRRSCSGTTVIASSGSQLGRAVRWADGELRRSHLAARADEKAPDPPAPRLDATRTRTFCRTARSCSCARARRSPKTRPPSTPASTCSNRAL